jgi:hypothetical protein
MLVCVVALPCRAGDHFLTIGGGSSASNNQVSLEKNVLYLQRFLGDAGLGDMPHEILFSDGTAGARDLQFDDPAIKPPRVNQILAELFNSERGLTTQYRRHHIPHLWGASGRQSIGKWFDMIGSKLHDGDRLFIYYTGHGGRGQGNPPTNQTLAIWNESDMPVKEFAGLLDKLPPRVQVVLIMVQCFGGGFADVIYNDADPAKGLSARNRCGFFATIPTRFAAGCTADVNEEDYHEYSTYFWAALYGQTRTGQPVAKPDYDGDGNVSLAEAHAYALIHSATVDISMKTSDAFLRRYSKLKPAGSGAISTETNFDRLCSVAAPADKAVLAELSAALGVTGSDRIRAATNKSEDVSRERRAIDQRKRKLEQSRNQLRRSLVSAVTDRWPELENFLHPASMKIIAEQADAIVKFAEALPRFDEFEKELRQIDDLEQQSETLERTWVKCQRLVRTAESVALAANLQKVAKMNLQERYQELVEAESGCLNREH